MWFAAIRRLALLVLASAAVTAAASVLVGLVLGASADRAISLGFYAVGCFLMVAGFFVGNRGPTRMKSDSDAVGGVFMFFGSRRLRWATLGEQNETINNSAVFVGLGVILVVFGILVDTRHSIV
jgi:hypothetical protein